MKNIFKDRITRKRSATDPYSEALSYFINEVGKYDPRQLKLLSEYGRYKELKNVIRIIRDKNDEYIEKLEIEDIEKYNQIKKELQIF